MVPRPDIGLSVYAYPLAHGQRPRKPVGPQVVIRTDNFSRI
jgi:hypothetical protein